MYANLCIHISITKSALIVNNSLYFITTLTLYQPPRSRDFS